MPVCRFLTVFDCNVELKMAVFIVMDDKSILLRFLTVFNLVLFSLVAVSLQQSVALYIKMRLFGLVEKGSCSPILTARSGTSINRNSVTTAALVKQACWLASGGAGGRSL